MPSPRSSVIATLIAWMSLSAPALAQWPQPVTPIPIEASTDPNARGRLCAIAQSYHRPDMLRPLVTSLLARGPEATDLESVQEILIWVEQRVRALPEPPGSDRWQDPAFTLRVGTGDCEDKALLVWSILSLFNIRGELILGTLDGKPHVWIMLPDLRAAIEATEALVLPWSTLYVMYRYDELTVVTPTSCIETPIYHVHEPN